MWLVCERADEARDNGYWFYKYVREKYPEQDCVYAIRKDSPDYGKVAGIGGEIIEFGSFRHWVYYLSADINISSQKEGKPNAAVCYLLEIYGIRKNRRVYLKHGIVKDDLNWHYYDVMKVWLYTCAAQREYDYCRERFRYPDDCIVLTGLCRYDNLVRNNAAEDYVLILPTSREWLARPISEYQKYDNVFDFANTEYYRCWAGFLTDERFLSQLREKKMKAVFFLHPNMQKYKEHFSGLSDEIVISDNAKDDLQTLMKHAALMITDYSSVYFDFAYMKKPLLYYQFDYEKYREGHYQEGYFSYEADGFGKVCHSTHSLTQAVLEIAENGFEMPEAYRRRADAFFAFSDDQNCERICQAIRRKRSGEG
ncbi:MAG: CDP-glycerol glycerophosphotransferase family protein [Oscillospiraceae bacterium]|nr:CDP-glycerol glycerophosphotransferase family protein [Oscillospiraceae bacterium]